MTTCFLLFSSQNMGFPIEQCEPAVKEFGAVQACIDAILAGKGLSKSSKLFCICICTCIIQPL